jgi:hypothetical protein
LLNYQWVIEETREETKSFLEVNGNENTMHGKLWDTAKAVLGGKFTVMSAYIKRTERTQINELMLSLKLLEKQEKVKPKTSKREMMKIRAKINETRINEINKKNGSLKK